MAFTWTPIASTQKITKTEFQELVTNIKSVENTLVTRNQMLAGSKFSWSAGSDPFAKTTIEAANLTELRNATDNIHNNNVCYQNYASHCGTHCGTNNSGYLSDYNTSNFATHYSGHNGNYNGAYYGTHYSLYLAIANNQKTSG